MAEQIHGRGPNGALEAVLVEALALGWRYTRAGKLVGLPRRAVSRRMQEAAFADAVSARRQALVAATTVRLMRFARVGTTIATLQRSLEAADPELRLRAARSALTLMRMLRQQSDLERSFGEVEQVIDGEDFPDDVSGA